MIDNDNSPFQGNPFESVQSGNQSPNLIQNQTHHQMEDQAESVKDNLSLRSSQSKLKMIANSKSELEPNQTELCQTICLLKEMLPNRSMEKVLTMLFKTIVEKKPPEDVFPGYVGVDKPTSEADSNYCYKPKDGKGVSRSYSKEDLLKTNFSKQEDQIKYKEKRLIAKSFVAKGYGFLYAQQQFSKAKFPSKMSKTIYKLLISSVVTQGFRRMQQFLKNECDKKIQPLSKDQMKKIMTPLLSSTYFGNFTNIFKKFLRLIYGLSAVTLQEVETVNFYLQVFKYLHNKKFTMESIERIVGGEGVNQNSQNGDSSGQNQSHQFKNNRDTNHKQAKNYQGKYLQMISNVQEVQKEGVQVQFKQSNYHIHDQGFQHDLVSVYMRKKSISRVKEIMQIKYPNHPCLQKKNIPVLQKLTSFQIRKILQSKDAQGIRVSLLQYYKEKTLNFDMLFFLVEVIADFIKNIEETANQDQFQLDEPRYTQIEEEEDIQDDIDERDLQFSISKDQIDMQELNAIERNIGNQLGDIGEF